MPASRVAISKVRAGCGVGGQPSGMKPRNRRAPRIAGDSASFRQMRYKNKMSKVGKQDP